jgi:hypothetical protein
MSPMEIREAGGISFKQVSSEPGAGQMDADDLEKALA